VTNWIITAAITFGLFSSNGIAQSKNTLIGTWRLVSAKDTIENGEVRNAYGQNPVGLLTYTGDGRMMAIITFDGRKPLSVTDRVSAPVEERAEAFSTFVAYAGSYTFTGDKVIHHVEAAWMQNMVNGDQVRVIVKLQRNRITLRTPPFLMGGVKVVQEELVWERMKSKTSP
jgi:lipocalin-like protein